MSAVLGVEVALGWEVVGVDVGIETVGCGRGMVLVVSELGASLCVSTTQVANSRLSRCFVPFHISSFRMYIFNSVIAVIVLTPSWLLSFMRVLPKTLNSCLQEAEFTQMDKICQAKVMNAGGS